MRTFILLYLSIFLIIPGHSQSNGFDPHKKYSPDSLKSWTTSLFTEMSKKHPGFYRYTTKNRFETLLDSTKLSITDSLTELEYYRKLKPLFAEIRCVHTGISLSEEYQAYIDQTNTLLPLEVFIDEDMKILITKNHDLKSPIPAGSQLISIDNEPSGKILRRIMAAIPADGYNETEKILLLNHRFAFWYQNIIAMKDQYDVEILHKGQTRMLTLKGVGMDLFPDINTLRENFDKPLELTIYNSVAVLTVHTFAKTVIKRYGQNFQRFVKKSFEKLDAEKTENLIIDLRYNTGGTDGNAVLLASYFFDQEFRYWDKIEVTESSANEIRGWTRMFYKRPENNNGKYQWKKTWVTSEFDYYEAQQPAKEPFHGNVYLITNGLCLSSCADLVAVLSDNGRALVTGQESGGGFQGNTSGMMPEVSIPTGSRVTIPLQKYSNAVDTAKNFGRGTIPDYSVQPTFQEWIAGEDVEMKFTLNLLRDE